MAIQDKFNKPNVIYKITKDIDLGGETLTIPEGCTLDFQGGSFSNGTIIGNETIIQDTLSKIFGLDITIQGELNIDFARPEWFGAKSDGNTDSTNAIQKVLDSFLVVKFGKGEYKVSKTITVTHCYTLFGVSHSQLYSQSSIVFSPTDDTYTTLFKLDGKIMPYFSISDICIYGPSPTVEGAVFKQNTIGIDTTSGNCVNLNNARIGRFECLIKSDFNSYYNKIDNCRLENSLYPLRYFNANNLSITNNRFVTFQEAISISSDGPCNIENNSFEIFNSNIINFRYKTGQVNFNNNYVEIYESNDLPALFADNNNGKFGGNILFSGEVRDFTMIGNQMQVNAAFRIFYLKDIENFVSINNHYLLFDNCKIQRFFYHDKKDVSVRNFICLDNTEWRVGTGFINQADISTIYTDSFSNGYIIGCDPITGYYLTGRGTQAVMPPNRTGGWWYDESNDLPFIAREIDGYHLWGKVVRRKDFSSEGSDVIATLPMSNKYQIIHNYKRRFKVFNSNYEEVILVYNPADYTLKIEHGSRDYDIYLDGVVIGKDY